jgi:hypothetical protein
MASRRPLVIVSGVTSELPIGDSVVGATAGTLAAGSGLNGGGALVGGTVTINASIAPAASGLIFAGGALAIDGSAQVAANTALASGNAALTGLSSKYNVTGGPITGTVTAQSQTIGTSSYINSSGTCILNLGANNNFEVVLTNNSLFAVPVSASGGQTGTIILRQDSVGSRLLTYSGAWSFPSNTAPTLTTTASGVDLLAFYVVNPNRINTVATLNFGSGTVG